MNEAQCEMLRKMSLEERQQLRETASGLELLLEEAEKLLGGRVSWTDKSDPSGPQPPDLAEELDNQSRHLRSVAKQYEQMANKIQTLAEHIRHLPPHE